jgi:beta-fructofuranosidase
VIAVLNLDDRWVWDFWTLDDGADHHIFYLQAPRALVDPELRHGHATVGHAVSADLRIWRLLPDALGPGSPGSWDDRAVWTGSAIRTGRRWAMLYTGTCHAERGSVQRIGLATSDDLVAWQKHPANPVLQADPHWYERFDARRWPEEAWRDPWLARQTGDAGYVALITARACDAPADGAGVIALASSRDLVDWTVGPPVTEPGWYGHMEVPQVSQIGGRWYLTFSVEAERYAASHPDKRAGTAMRGIRYRTSPSPLGPFTAATDRRLFADRHGSRYAGKIVRSAGRDFLMSFRCFGPDGAFQGVIDEPIPLIERRGDLSMGGTP